jgi:guanine nucleotide exchange protein RalF
MPIELSKEIIKEQRDICEIFNAKPKNGIEKIKAICKSNNIEKPEEQIALFFHQQHRNVDLEAVGDYLSGPDEENKKALKDFTRKIDLTGQSFTQGLRNFLKSFKLPGEAQKIDRLVESFSEAYCQQNPGGNIANKDAGYILAFQTIMLNTDLHNPSIAAKNKMDFNGLKRNLRGCNREADFDENFLRGIYDDIKANPFELNFVKNNPGYEINSRALDYDATFSNLALLFQSNNTRIQNIFVGLDDAIKVTVNQPKSWLIDLIGYNGTITLSDENSPLVTIQVYKPSIISKCLFGEQPKIIIQPACKDGKMAQEEINLAAKIAATFQSTITGVKATYDYEKSDLEIAYYKETKPSTLIKTSSSKHGFWEYKALEKFSYDPDINNQGERVVSGKQTLSDWNREISSEDNTQVFIEGKSISSVRNGEKFSSIEELKEFFMNTLFSQISDEKLKENLAKESLKIFHQGGLPFASHYCLVSLNQKSNIKLPGEIIKVNFSPNEEGVLITEENTYANLSIGNKIYKSHTYHAKTESQVLFGKDGIDIKEMTIDCPSRHAATILDKRTFCELFMHVIDKIRSMIQCCDSKPVARNA